MSGEGSFPFDQAKLASLATLASDINGRNAPPPFAEPIVVTANGNAWLPYPFRNDHKAFVQVNAGMHLGWSPMPEVSAVLLSIWGTEPSDAFGHHNVTATLTRPGLKALIADLQAIDAALDGAA